MNAGTGLLIVISLFNLAAMVVFYLLMKSRFSTKKILAEIRLEVDKLVSDLGREADRDVALLESRIRSLRSLMDEVDRRILLADKEESKRKTSDSLIAEIGPVQPEHSERPALRSTATQPSLASSRQSEPSLSRPPSTRHDTVAASREPELFPPEADPLYGIDQPSLVNPVQPPKSPESVKPVVDAVKVYSRPVIKRSETRIDPVIPVSEKVLDLSMKGLSADMIAHTLSISLGEVELILDMNDSSL